MSEWGTRGLRPEQAAYYVGMKKSSFLVKVASKVPPVKIGRSTIWLREDLDQYMDRIANKPPSSMSEDIFEEALKEHGSY